MEFKVVLNNNPTEESQPVLSSKGGPASPQKNISGDLFSSRLIQESPLSEEVFNTSKSTSSPQSNHQNSQADSWWSHNHSLRTAFYVGAAIVACLLLLSGLALYFSKNKTSKPVAQYGNTSADLTSLSTVRADSAPGLVVVNGNTVINGSITANSFTGNGADLTNLNATNITQGTLNDARLSANIALLNGNQTFTGTNLFTGQVSLPVTTSIAGQNYNWPQSQGAGVLTNDGTGTLVWNTAGGCLTCLNQGGNSFAAPVVIGSNDSFNLIFRAGGVNRFTLSPAGSASLNGSLSANSFSGDGSALTTLNASQIMSGTLSNARLSVSVTTQGNVFNGIDQLVQLNNLGYLPAINGGNLTSLNASNITSGTLLDVRLSTNVAKLDTNQAFTGTNSFSQPITVNTLTPTGAMTIGVTNQNLTLRGNGSTSLSSTNAGGTVNVGFNGISAGGLNYQFDATTAPGTYTICTTAGGAGCGGGGGGGTVSSPGGTSNKLAKFTGAQSIADSSITDTGALVSIAAPNVSINGAPGAYALDVTGDINAGTYLRVGGNVVCDSTGCVAGGGGGAYIQNSTGLQSAANFNFQSSAAGAVGGKIRGAVAQTADLLEFQNSGGTVLANIDAGGNINTTGQYQINGVAYASSNLSDGSNLAKLNANQNFTGNNTFEGTFVARNAADSTTGFTVKNSSGINILVVDTTNQRVAIGTGAPAYPLDVSGDINSSTGLRVGGNLVCDITGCAASGSSGFYIQNGVAQQTSANFNIQSGNVNDVVGVLQGKSGQVADLFQVKDGTGTTVFKVSNTGLTTINNGITLTGGNQSITNNTGGLSLISNGTTIALNATSTITSGDGTGLRYAANYAYQPLSLVSRQYVDDAISGVVVGACPTCFLKGGNSFGTSASLGTIDNYILTIKTANTTRITLGTDGSVAFAGSTASNSYAISAGSGTASGYVSFAGGELTIAASQDSFAMGYQSQVTAGLAAVALGRQTTASNNYAMATGYLSTASGEASFASGRGTASGSYSFATGGGTASGQDSFAGGYNQNPITASGLGSFAYGRAEGFAITAAGPGSIAIGYTQSGATISNGAGALAGGSNSSTGVGANFSIAYGNGTQANGLYSAAFNNSIASGTGAFSVGSGTASGQSSFAGGYNQSPITASGTGSFAFGRAEGFAITAAGPGSFALGYSQSGAITANGAGSFAGGDSSSTGVGANFSIAFGTGTQANGLYSAAFNNSIASGTGAFSVGSGTASGQSSFAGGESGTQAYARRSFAFGYNAKANNLSGEGAIAFGRDTTANNNYSFAAGYGATASGEGSVALNSSNASGSGAFSVGSSLVTASGTNSFAGGYAQSPITASNNGSFAFGRSVGFAITAAGEGSLAIGQSGAGAIIANGSGSFAGGDNSSTGVGAHWSIAFGTGTQANGLYSAAFNNSIASGTGAFSVGSGTASGQSSFAGGYAQSAITSSSNGSFAFGRSIGFAITAAGEGSMAIGQSGVGAIIANGSGSFAGGDNSSTGVGAHWSIAFGTGTQANGLYSAAFNNSIASGTGAFSVGNGTASGALSFAGGETGTQAYNRNSFAFGTNARANQTVGVGAIAFGNNTVANHNFATAFGNGSQATGDTATAFGNGIASGSYSFATAGGTASGQQSFAGGYNVNPITASGLGSFAYGRTGLAITAAGEGSVAFGYTDSGANIANGNGSLVGGSNSSTGVGARESIAFGDGTQANGQYSAAFNNSIASNTGAFAVNNGTASGLFSFAGGEGGTRAYQRDSFAFGYNAKANSISGQQSFALGNNVTADGNYSYAFGNGAVASAEGAFAFGANSTASGTYSIAGYNSTASNNGAFAFGDTNTASGQFSTTFGTLNTASGFNSTSFGRRMNVSGNYSFGVSLNDTALSVTDANSFVINAGYVGINTASPLSYASAFSVVGNGYSYGSTITSTGIASRVRAGDNSSGTLIQFERADATVVGSITHNGANTAYNVASDARLKHDLVDTSYSLDTVLQLKIHDYKYNADSTNTTYTGFIAQELQKLFPDAVSVMDTKTGYLGVDYGKLTPLLAKGIQDLNTKVDGLQTQLDALKTTSTPSVVPIDVVAELAKVSAITINGDLTVNGKVIVVGNLELKGDNTGVIKIPAGLTRVHLSFTKPFTTAPNVTLTSKGLTKATYAVDGETTTGFDVILDVAQTQETILNYHAL